MHGGRSQGRDVGVSLRWLPSLHLSKRCCGGAQKPPARTDCKSQRGVRESRRPGRAERQGADSCRAGRHEKNGGPTALDQGASWGREGTGSRPGGGLDRGSEEARGKCPVWAGQRVKEWATPLRGGEEDKGSATVTAAQYGGIRWRRHEAKSFGRGHAHTPLDRKTVHAAVFYKRRRRENKANFCEIRGQPRTLRDTVTRHARSPAGHGRHASCCEQHT